MNIEDVKAFIRGKSQMPILHVRDSSDPKYKGIEKFVSDVDPNMEVYMHSVASKLSNLFDTLRHMESNDYNKVVNTFKKYEVKGKSSGISGERRYAYDKSRVDGKLIRRRRAN